MNIVRGLRLDCRRQAGRFVLGIIATLLLGGIHATARAESCSHDVPVSVTIAPQMTLSTQPAPAAAVPAVAAPLAPDTSVTRPPLAVKLTVGSNWGAPESVTTQQTTASDAGVVYTVTSL